MISKSGGASGPEEARAGEQSAARSGAQAIERAIKVMTCFGDPDPELTLSQVARRVELPLSTTHRIMQALVRGEYLEQRRERYRVGRRLADLAQLAQPPRVDVGDAIPHLYALSARIKLTVSFAVAEGDEILTLVSARPTVRSCSHQIPASRQPLHSMALGQAILAFDPAGPRAALERLGTPHSFAARPFAAPGGLLSELREVRQRGFAVSEEVHAEHVRAVAVPTFAGQPAAVVGALGVQARSKRLTDGLIRDLVPVLRHFSAEVGRRVRLVEREA